ncbi:hypothetical protein ETAA8_33310 [Anatilimnocola aggregata]|uniref:YtkA-like domain-containing protein n=1 Tax=Anatilimnocola aggregata TaxID=2528021 RepID=A0A517YDC1_9BACT|nr:hypothetical protein [Anatilimnocola aggregata]QDU28231.1 hypothetical protein ETAA8_33310 [Anatilimnocola aggregata]
MRTNLSLLIVTSLTMLCPHMASADGGTVRLLERRGSQTITVFTSPAPLRAGIIDVSVLVQDQTGTVAMREVAIEVVAQPRDHSGPIIRLPATTDAATNKLLRAAKFNLPHSGWWQVEVVMHSPNQPTERFHFDVEVAPAQPRWVTFWPWFTWPILAIVLFAWHQWRAPSRDCTKVN